MSDSLKAVLNSPKFWVALLAVGQTILFQFVPNFPANVWEVLDALAVVVIGLMFGSDIHQLKRQITAVQARDATPPPADQA